MRTGWSSRTRAAADCVLVAVVALAVYVMHGYEGGIGTDLGVFLYGGERFAAGVPPYVGVFNTVGPLADAVPGVAIWLGRLVGVEPVSAARHVFTALAAGCCVLVYVLARQVLRRRSAGLLAAAVFLTFGQFIHLASDGPREKTAMLLFLLASLVLLGRRRWVAAGVFTALATLTWQPAFAVGAAAAAVAVLGAPDRRVRATVAFAAGGVVPAAVAVLYYLVQGHLGVAIDGFVVVNVRYTQQTVLIDAPRKLLGLFWENYHWSLLVLVAGLACLLVVTVMALRTRPRPVALLVVGAGGAVGTAWTIVGANGAPDLFVLLPFGAIGVAAVVAPAAARLRRGGAVLVAAVVVAAVLGAVQQSLVYRDHALVDQRRNVTAVMAAAPPGATLLSLNAPAVLVLAGRTNPSPYQLFQPAVEAYVEHTRPQGLAGYAAWIARTRPTLIARSGVGQEWPDAVIAQDYWRVGRGPGWTWYLSRSAATATLEELRAANRRSYRPDSSSAVAPRGSSLLE